MRLSAIVCFALLGAGAVLPSAAAEEGEGLSLERIEAAIERLEIERRRAGTDERRNRIVSRLADLEVLRARRLAREGRDFEAVSAYERALSLVTGHRIASLELGWISLTTDEDERARRVVETATMVHPDDPGLLELRGEIAYRAHRLEEAAEHYRRASELAPERSRLKERLQKIERERASESDFDRADSSHFTVRFDGERDERVASLLLDVLEHELSDLVRELDTVPGQPITTVLYTRREFHDTTRTPREVAGLFDGKIRLPVGGIRRITEDVRRVVRHELVHSLLHVKGRNRVPRWLHEGIAQLLEPEEPKAAHDWMARRLPHSEDASLEPFSYPRSLSFVAFLDERYSRSRLLWLVELLAEGRLENDAFLEAYNDEKGELVERWGRWLIRRR